jgi:hypothetical protein
VDTAELYRSAHYNAIWWFGLAVKHRMYSTVGPATQAERNMFIKKNCQNAEKCLASWYIRTCITRTVMPYLKNVC